MPVRVAIIDVGSNTVRLLVAERSKSGLRPLREERVFLGLGEEIERLGWISAEKAAETVATAAEYAAIARELRVELMNVVVTAPGRQSANGEELMRALESATHARVRVLTPDEEGELAFEGALASADPGVRSIAVCDVGGGSTEVVVGTPSGGIAWCRSFDIGCLRLTHRVLVDDPPDAKRIEAARREVEDHLHELTPPLAEAALITGGTARALRKVVGRRLGRDELEEALRRLTKRPSAEIAKKYAIDRVRARTLVAGTLITMAVQERVAIPLEVSRSGLREGAAAELLGELAAA